MDCKSYQATNIPRISCPGKVGLQKTKYKTQEMITLEIFPVLWFSIIQSDCLKNEYRQKKKYYAQLLDCKEEGILHK